MKRKLFSPKSAIFVLYIIINYFAFRNLNLTFYQQDEWLGLGQILAEGWKSVTNGFSFWQILFADGRPMTRVFGVLFFGPFAYNSTFLAIYSIGFHIINTFLVFLIAQKLFKKTIPAFVAGLFFALNSVSSQAVTWFGASFGTQPAAFLTIYSIYLFVLFLDIKKTKYFYWSMVFAIVSLYFKESDVFLFIFFPFIHFFYENNRKKLFEFYKKLYLPFIIFIAIFCIFRVSEMLFVQNNPQSILTSQVFANIGTHDIFLSILYRLILYPLTSLSLIYIPAPVSSVLGFSLFQSYYSSVVVNHPDAVIDTVVIDLIATFFSFLILFFIGLIWLKNTQIRKTLIFSLTLFILSIIPYIVLAKGYAYLEPRYYYITNVSAALLLGSFLLYLMKSKFFAKKFVLAILSIFIVLCLYFNVVVIREGIHEQMFLATERRSYLQQLITYLPTLTNNTNVFYITGNTPWLVDGNKTPFQNGFGYTLMVLYFKSGKVSDELLSNGYLWMLGAQGYQKIDEKAFGFYDYYNNLKNSVSNNKIPLSDVHAYYYNSQTRVLSDISKKIRNDLAEGKKED